MNINSYKLLILSQVALSLQLPFTIIPLLLLARNRRLMGEFASKGSEWVLGILVAVVVIGLNVLLLYRTFGGTFKVW